MLYKTTEINQEIVTPFIGEINGVRVYKERVYNSTLFILENIVNLGYNFSEMFIRWFIHDFERVYLKVDDITLQEMEEELFNTLNDDARIGGRFGLDEYFEASNEYFQEVNGEEK